MKKFFLNDPIYGANWVVVFGGELHQAINLFCKKYKVPHTESAKDTIGRYGHFFTYTPFKGGLIWFPDLRPSSGTIAHESLHAVHYMLSNCLEASLIDANEEIYAYYLQWLVQEIKDRSK